MLRIFLIVMMWIFGFIRAAIVPITFSFFLRVSMNLLNTCWWKSDKFDGTFRGVWARKFWVQGVWMLCRLNIKESRLSCQIFTELMGIPYRITQIEVCVKLFFWQRACSLEFYRVQVRGIDWGMLVVFCSTILVVLLCGRISCFEWTQLDACGFGSHT